MFSSFVWENQRQPRNSASFQKMLRQKARGEKTSAFSARTVNNHLYVPTCGFENSSHTRVDTRGELKLILKLSLKKIKTLENIQTKT